jgi:hypothetical protein
MFWSTGVPSEYRSIIRSIGVPKSRSVDTPLLKGLIVCLTNLNLEKNLNQRRASLLPQSKWKLDLFNLKHLRLLVSTQVLHKFFSLEQTCEHLLFIMSFLVISLNGILEHEIIQKMTWMDICSWSILRQRIVNYLVARLLIFVLNYTSNSLPTWQMLLSWGWGWGCGCVCPVSPTLIPSTSRFLFALVYDRM